MKFRYENSDGIVLFHFMIYLTSVQIVKNPLQNQFFVL